MTFYIVYSPQGTTPPVKQHSGHPEALAEAHRLAKLHPGQDFFVMKSKSKPVRREVEGEGE